jgi:hypothetical protein
MKEQLEILNRPLHMYMYNKGDNRMRRNIPESLLGSGKKAFITKLKSYKKIQKS